MYTTHEKLVKELDYLDMSKHPVFVSQAISALDRSYILVEYLYKDILGESGDIIIPKFFFLDLKHVHKATYKQLIQTLASELEAFCHDYVGTSHLDDVKVHTLLTNFWSSMVEAYMWINKENERLKVEALPEINKIDLPEETVPEIPEGPAPEPVTEP